jgi:hypothetical protein
MDNYSKPTRLSKIWYLIPLFFGTLGGILSYLLVRDNDRKFAKKLLMIGIIRDIIILVPPVIATVIRWYIPFVEKQAESQTLLNAYNLAFRVAERIETTIATGERQYLLTPKGIFWIVDNSSNSVILKIRSKATNIDTTNNWIQLSKGEGTIVYARSNPIDNEFEIQYKIEVIQPFILESNKLSSFAVKKIEIFKKDNKIEISLIE